MGLEAMDEIQQKMQAIRQSLGFSGTAAQFHLKLQNDKRFYADSPEEVEQRYAAFIDRVEPHLPDYFSQQPKTPMD